MIKDRREVPDLVCVDRSTGAQQQVMLGKGAVVCSHASELSQQPRAEKRQSPDLVLRQDGVGIPVRFEERAVARSLAIDRVLVGIDQAGLGVGYERRGKLEGSGFGLARSPGEI